MNTWPAQDGYKEFVHGGMQLPVWDGEIYNLIYKLMTSKLELKRWNQTRDKIDTRISNIEAEYNALLLQVDDNLSDVKFINKKWYAKVYNYDS